MSSIYERYGIRPIVNARGNHTRLGGSIMAPEVLEAMHSAAQSFVVLEELQARASELIARATGAEAGMVTGGAASGLLSGTAACITRGAPGKIERLPDLTGMKNEVVMFRAHRNGYDHSVRATGVHIVDVGYAHSTHAYQLEAALSEHTAAVVYLVAPWAANGALSLEQTCDIARRYEIPVLVDAAAVLPPMSNLKRFIAEGADLVTFSGGKGIGGPQSSGILAGRTDLIRAALANGSPNHSIGRTAKASKEDIIGLMVALERYLARDHAADFARWQAQAEYLVKALGDFPGVEASYRYDGKEYLSPSVELAFNRGETGIDAHELVLSLENDDPRVFLIEWVGTSASPNNATIITLTMQPGDEETIASVVGRAISEQLIKNSPQTIAGDY